MDEKLSEYAAALEGLRTSLHTTCESIANQESAKGELEHLSSGRDKLIDALFHSPAARGNGEKASKLTELSQKRELSQAKLEFLVRQIDQSILSLQSQLSPLQICLTTLHLELSNQLFSEARHAVALLVHADSAEREDIAQAIYLIASEAEAVRELRELRVPSVPFIQSLAGVGYTFPQSREAIIESTLQASRNLLDAGEELLVEAEKASAEGFSPPAFNPNVLAEQEAAAQLERHGALPYRQAAPGRIWYGRVWSPRSPRHRSGRYGDQGPFRLPPAP